MVEVIGLIDKLAKLLSNDVPFALKLIFFTLVIVLYSIFAFYFSKFVAKKDIIKLNLNQYNNYENKNLVKFFAFIFYIIEYIIILPLLSSFWFFFLSLFLLILSEGMSIELVLMVSASVVASIRVVAYVSEDLSSELSRLVPFTLILIAVTKPSFFVFGELLKKFLSLPNFLELIPYYLIFIVSVELFMRISSVIFDSFKDEPEYYENQN